MFRSGSGGFRAVLAALQVTGPALWVLLSRPALCAAAGRDDTAATAKTVAKDCEEAVSTRHAAGFTDNLKCLKKIHPYNREFHICHKKNP